MLLLPIIGALWFGLLLWAIAWLVLPVGLVWFGKYRIAIVVVLWWAIMFAVMAYFAFEISAKPYHPNRDAALGSSFAFVIAVIACLTSLSSAVLILVFRRQTAKALPIEMPKDSTE